MSASRLEFIEHSDHDWQIFAASQKQANIFHHVAWSRLMQECYGYRSFVVIVRDAKGQICAGLPMMEVEGPFSRRRWVSIPFSDHCSPLYCNLAALEKLTSALAFEAQQSASLKLEVRWNLF